MKFFSSMSSVGRRLFAPGAAARPPAFVVSRERRPAREIATRELRSEWSISRPALALPPPTGTAATGTATRPHTQPSRAPFLHPPPIPHVIPPRLFQTLNS